MEPFYILYHISIHKVDQQCKILQLNTSKEGLKSDGVDCKIKTNRFIV